MKFSTIQIGDGIFETIRKKVVEKGYLPDIANYYPGNKPGYQAAKDQIISSGKRLIEVFNVGNWKSRDEKNTGEIILDRIGISASEIGRVKRSFKYDVNGSDDNLYDKKEQPSSRYNVEFQLTYLTDLEEYADIIDSILIESLGIKKLISALNDNQEEVGKFWLFRSADFDTSGKDFIERGYRYTAKWVDLEDDIDHGTVHKFTDFEHDLIAAFSYEVQDINNFLE